MESILESDHQSLGPITENMKRLMTFMLGLALLATTAVAIYTPTPEPIYTPTPEPQKEDAGKKKKVANKKSTPEKKSTKQRPSTTSSNDPQVARRMPAVRD